MSEVYNGIGTANYQADRTKLHRQPLRNFLRHVAIQFEFGKDYIDPEEQAKILASISTFTEITRNKNASSGNSDPSTAVVSQTFDPTGLPQSVNTAFYAPELSGEIPHPTSRPQSVDSAFYSPDLSGTPIRHDEGTSPIRSPAASARPTPGDETEDETEEDTEEDTEDEDGIPSHVAQFFSRKRKTVPKDWPEDLRRELRQVSSRHRKLDKAWLNAKDAEKSAKKAKDVEEKKIKALIVKASKSAAKPPKSDSELMPPPKWKPSAQKPTQNGPNKPKPAAATAAPTTSGAAPPRRSPRIAQLQGETATAAADVAKPKSALEKRKAKDNNAGPKSKRGKK